MTRLFKVVGIVIVAFLALLLVAGLAVKFFFDPNDYKDDIAALVKGKTGRELVIEGDLGLSIFPWLAVDLGRTRLSNAPGFGDKPFAEIASASVSLRLVPLILRREIEVGTISLEGLKLDLARDKQGRTNWDDLMAALAEEEAPAPEKPEAKKEVELAVLSIGGLSVTHAEVAWTDRQAGTGYELKKFDFKTGTLAPDKPFKFENSFNLISKSPSLDLQAELGGTASVDLQSNAYTVEGFSFAFKATGEAVPADPTEGKITAETLRLDLNNQTMALERFAGGVLGLELEGQLEGQNIVDDPRLRGTLAVQQFNARELLARIGSPMETADPDVLKKVSLTSNVDYAKGRTSLEGMRLSLDQSEIKGALSVDTNSALRFDLDVDEIDLDRYLPPDEGKTAEEAESAAPSDEVEVPVELIRQLNATGKVQVGKARLSGLKFENVELGLKASNGRVQLHPLQAAFYGGTYRGDIRLDTNGGASVLRLDEHIVNAQIGELARDLYKKERLSGKTSADLVLTAKGNKLGEMRRSLSGNVGFKLENGAIEGFNLWHEISKVRAALDKDLAGKVSQSAPNRTEFSNLGGTGVVQDAIVTTSDLVAQLPFLNVTGGGTVDLIEDQVNLQLRAVVLDTPDLEAQAAMADLKGFTIPVKVTGDTFAPKIRPDVAGLAKQEVKQKKEEAKAKVKERLLEKIGVAEGGQAAEATQASEAEAAATAQAEPKEAEEKPKDPEEQLKDEAKRKLLKKIFD